MRTAKAIAVVDEIAIVRQIRRCQFGGPVFAERMSQGQINGSIGWQMSRTIAIKKA